VAETLVSMKMSKAEVKQDAPIAASEDEGPRYPYGLQLRLDQSTLDKLDRKLPKLGDEFMLVAQVKVTSVSSYENVGQPAHSNVELQITKMCLEDSAEDAADTLYGEQD
jgi:Major coat protein-like